MSIPLFDVRFYDRHDREHFRHCLGCTERRTKVIRGLGASIHQLGQKAALEALGQQAERP